MIAADSFDELQRQLMAILSVSREAAPRGQRVREVLACTLRLNDPRARLTASPTRAANYGFAAGEFCWYLRGARDLESIAYYNRRMTNYSDDGRTLNSAYGYRLREETAPSQWEQVREELRRDPDSRRAVMTIFRPADLSAALDPGSKDVPCTLALQFFIRHGRLNLHVTMRSNDAVWGLANDLFSFTLLQETMALELGVELGAYYHTAGSMHLYERYYADAEQIEREDRDADSMPAVESRADLDVLMDEEEQLRLGRRHFYKLHGGAGWLHDRLVEHRAKRDAEALADSVAGGGRVP